jgi:hypothetical protein
MDLRRAVMHCTKTSLKRLALSALFAPALSGCPSDDDANATPKGGQSGCIEERTALQGRDSSALGVTGSEALQWLGSERSGKLSWLRGTAPETDVKFTFSDARAFLVQSKPDPNFGLAIVVHCEDHIEVEVLVAFATADGKLSFDDQRVRLTADASTHSLAGVIGGVDAKELRGSYQPAAANECFQMTQLNVSFSETEMSGTLVDTIAAASCSALGGLTAVGPREGARWSQPAQVPDGWSEVQTQCHFAFYAPAELHAVDARGVDSCVALFETPECGFGADYGGFSDPLTDYSQQLEYSSEVIRVDTGREATLVHFKFAESSDGRPYFAGLHVPRTSPESPTVALTFSAQCNSATAQSDAVRVLRTVALMP